MKNIKLLDCTLRDGGYINDWDFGKNTIINVYSRLVASGIDLIELGFINDSYKYDENRSIVPNTKYLKNVFDFKIKGNAKLLAMVILGECAIENIGEKSDTPIDILRIVFKKKKMDEAFEFAKQCREKGYEIFLQPASVTDYNDDEMLNLIKKANAFMPSAVYIVDTYGLLDKESMYHYLSLLDEHLDMGITIGYHSHNNYQLSYATAIEFVEKQKKHQTIVDCTLFGMGKTVGNLNTELIVDYMNKHHNTKYDNFQILEAIDSEILKIRQTYSWGYSLNGFIAASNRCHPKYVSYLLAKRSLSVGSINKILSKIDKDNLTTFNKALIDKLFMEYQSVEFDDEGTIAQLKKVLNRDVLILATGASLTLEKDKINQFIKDKNPIIISVNYDPDNYKEDYCFINNSKRFSQMGVFVNNNLTTKIIATSNIVSASRQIDYLISYSNLLVEGDVNIISDNATLMLFNLLLKCGVDKCYVAGFDGFKLNTNNYVDKYLSYNDNNNIVEQNTLLKEKLKEFRTKMDIVLITESCYE